jgi:hypothetical protein
MSRYNRLPTFKLPAHRQGQQIHFIVEMEWYQKYSNEGKVQTDRLHPTRSLINSQGLNGPIIRRGMKLNEDCA